MKFELESYKTDIKVCPKCGGPLEFTAVFHVNVYYKIDPKTGRISKKPVEVYASEVESQAHFCRNCERDVEFMEESPCKV
jgi:hypothetical protein